MSFFPSSPRQSPTSRVNLNQAPELVISTGRSSSSSTDQEGSVMSSPSSELGFTLNYQEAPLPNHMSGRRTPESPTRNLRLDPSPSSGTLNEIGTLFGTWRNQDNSTELTEAFWFVITAPSRGSVRTICNLHPWSGPSLYSGERLVQESLDWRGNSQVWQLTLKIQEPSFGMVTRARNMLLLTNFEEVLTSPMSYDGLTGILSLWRSRDLQLF